MADVLHGSQSQKDTSVRAKLCLKLKGKKKIGFNRMIEYKLYEKINLNRNKTIEPKKSSLAIRAFVPWRLFLQARSVFKQS